ncbi:MAG: class I SAM-dependent methyltransferase [SAR202 cluster bacterium]|nr:class I SAM-dependent methyltransferase [SAR202 cluster bacterium]
MRVVEEQAIKKKVAEFWDLAPCGSFASHVQPGELEFFVEVERYREANQSFVRHLVDFRRFAGLGMLEVGCGLGTDLLCAASLGANTVGMDLSLRSAGLARRHFQLKRMPGDFLRADAERLPYKDGSFDVVYSFGVLHHTTDTQAAINECRRVLKPGGTLVLMLYNRTSWYVHVEPYLVSLKRLMLRQPTLVGGMDKTEVIRRHDGAGNPLGKAYSPSEIKEMLSGFERTKLAIRHPRVVNGGRVATAYGRLMEWSGITSRWGFWIIAQSVKPTQTAVT